MRIVSILAVIAVAVSVSFCGFSPQPTSGTVACMPGGAGCCPQDYVCVGRVAATADGLSDGSGTCWREQDLPVEALLALHDETPSVANDPACLVTDWLPPGLGGLDAGNLGTGGRRAVGVGIDGAVSGDDAAVPGPGPTTPPISTAGTFGGFPQGSPSAVTNRATNATHDNAQPNDVVTSPLARKWTADFTGTVSTPIVANGRVYVSAKEFPPNVRALDVETGTLVWGPIALGATIGMACDAVHLYVLDSGGTLTALDQTSGQTRWTIKLMKSSFSSAPTAAAGMVYVNGSGWGGNTFAVDGATGKLVWTAETYDGSDGSVAVADGVVYEAEACGQISAFDAKTGRLKWFAHLRSCTGGGGVTPIVCQKHIWIPDSDDNFILDMDGKQTGTFAADLYPSFHAGTAYFVGNGTLTAVDATSQTPKWTFSPPEDDYVSTWAVIAGRGGQVFVGSDDGYVYEIKEADGTLISSAKVVDDLVGHPSGLAIAHNRLFVPVDKKLLAY
jgi:outer membrane protein assembly factor BamB